jgi:DNA-binding XRE family transcriptional regulator
MVAKRRADLARARKAAGYTQEALAEALYIDRSTVIRWEAGKYSPVPYLWPKLAKLLGVTRERLQELFTDEEVKPGNALAPVPTDHVPAAVTDSTRLLSDLTSWASDLNRRELLRLLGVASAEVTVPPLLAGLTSDDQDRVAHTMGAPSRVDELAIQHMESMLHAAMHQDDALGPHAVLDTVLAQRRLVQTLLVDCPSALRSRLLTLYSNMSRFAGWLSFDLADYDTSSRYYEAARLAAHEAEDTDLSVFVLCNMSHLATWQGRPRVGIDHAMAAQNWSNDTDDGLLRAYTADVAARAYAGMGNRRAAFEALETAQAGITDTSPQTPGTSLAYFYGPAQLAQTSSLCLLQLGDIAPAEQAARESLAQMGSSFVRNQAFSTIHLGNAYLAAGELEQAAAVVGDGAALAARNRSARVVQTIAQTRASMKQWENTPAVRELDAKLVSYGLLPSSTT